MTRPIQFGEYLFHYKTGEIFHSQSQEDEPFARLGPQPSKLLLLLTLNYPEIVSRKTINELIWPDVQVDFDKSLHFCIRQIRSALNEDASNPRFIQTIPRRGYRWIAPVSKGGVDLEYLNNEFPGRAERIAKSSIKPDRARNLSVVIGHLNSFRNRIIAGGIILVLFLILFIIPQEKGELRNQSPVNQNQARVAIMTFLPDDPGHLFSGNDIALRLIATLTEQYKDSLQIIGPTTTSNYRERPLQELIDEFDIDLIINGRFSNEDHNGRLLGEVIRAADGAHIWVKYFDAEYGSGAIADEITEGLHKVLAADLAPE